MVEFELEKKLKLNSAKDKPGLKKWSLVPWLFCFNNFNVFVKKKKKKEKKTISRPA